MATKKKTPKTELVKADEHEECHIMTLDMKTLAWSCNCGASGQNNLPSHMDEPGPRYWGYRIIGPASNVKPRITKARKK